jgi:hypothetical protein
MSHKVATCDIYEAVYYSLNGSSLETIEGIQVNGKVACKLIFEGDTLPELQIRYLNGEAEVNLFMFRRMFGQLNAWINKSRKKFKNQLKQHQTLEAGGEL